MKNIYLFILFLFGTITSFSQIINFPDTNFKNALLSATATNNVAQDAESNSIIIDANGNDEIEVSEVLAVYELNVSSNNISDLSGIENFTNLTILNCGLNQITTLDVTSLSNLQNLRCTNNGMTSLLVSGLSNLFNIEAFSNQLTSLDVTGLIALTDLKLSNNQITDLDVSNLTNLEYVVASYMDLATLTFGFHPNLTNVEFVNTLITDVDLSESTALESLICYGSQLTNLVLDNLENLGIVNATDNQIATISLTNTPSLWNLMVSQNNLTFLDASECTGLTSLSCGNNQLETLFVKNGASEDIYFAENTNLQYICADGEEISAITDDLQFLGYDNVNLNSYCSFTPGGEFFTTEGTVKHDFNQNGCDPGDTPMPFTSFLISGIDGTGTFFANNQGVYEYPVQEGNYTITPVLENTNYFSVSPPQITANFPADASPLIQDYCLVPIGVHPDLEITIIPTNPAVPGFDAEYTVVYHNKGNQVQSGEIHFTFFDERVDYVSSNPMFDSEAPNLLIFQYTDLIPFETREIDLIFNVHSPMNPQPINIGDELGFAASIEPIVGDETFEDNTFSIKQDVVGSFDPNDIRCLQGESVDIDIIDNFVHYLIRFENTGNFPAQNIVVTDTINTQQFDVSSLQPLHGSHSFETRITDNFVEFIFEDIMLPFDDANNDGHVLFKIKTLPNLVLGDTFDNKAAIYFDFNFPVITNTYVTTIENQLSVAEFESFNDYLIYPNPATQTLNIKTPLQIENYEILNLLGQSIVSPTIINSEHSIAISELQAGHYFLKLNSNKGFSYIKFIKQ